MLQLMGSQKVDTTQWLNNEQDTCTHLEYVLYIESMKWSEVSQSCLTLCHPMDYSLLGSSVHGIFQARILEWVAISFSRGTSWPRDQTWVSLIVGRRITIWATCNAMDCQARVLEWIAISFSRGSYQPRDQTRVFWITGRLFIIWAFREAPKCIFNKM